MPDTGYIVTNQVTDGGGGTSVFAGWTTDDDTLTRIRDGQTGTATFSGLSVPAGATINGIEVEMDVSTLNGAEAGNTGDWIKVNNGSSNSTAKSTTAGSSWVTFDGLSGSSGTRIAGGSSDLWGLSWDSTTANNITVILGWGTLNGDAYYLDFLRVKIHYTGGTVEVTPTYAPNGEKAFSISNGKLVVSDGTIEVK